MASIKTIQETFEPLFSIGLTPLIIGPHGLGKSSIVAQYAKAKGIGFVDLRLGTQDVGDLIGLADFVKDASGQSIATRFMRPDWFPTEGEGIIFLDELNRAPKYVLQAIFQLLLERRLHRHVLPSGWKIVAAANPPSGDYTVTDMSDKAFLDRFCILKLENSVHDFLSYAKSSEFSDNVIEYITTHNEMLSGKVEDWNVDEFVKPSNRTWEFVSRLDKIEMEDDIRRTILRGMIGFSGTVHYMDFREKNQLNVTSEDILNNYSKVKKKLEKLVNVDNPRIDQLALLVDKLVKDSNDNKLTSKQINNLVDFLVLIPKDVTVKYLKMISEICRDIIASDNTTSHAETNFKALKSAKNYSELFKQLQSITDTSTAKKES